MACGDPRFIRRSLFLALLCAALALIVGLARRQGLIPPSLRWLAALLPVLPMIWYFLGLGAWLRTIDEMQRLIQLEALLVQFGITGLLVMAWGLLAKFQVVPNTPIADAWGWLWMLIFFSWALGQLIVRRKYR
jgi:hypothetical protein